ncbi:CBM35 domain-containing protein [Yinghuangia soli]|uniref:CBM6 domain-containing protein n=1 Tax=Yinghuangia soli TaxID=2908204 RepID=A0AA41U365_9ACTN|nr:CBM35 domain-containing protein [Yinghuangia soli]MCF2529382.1 hypothetical protein [Yinghuangia soli]
MTVGTEGEPDDPFGYLYRPGPGDAQGGGTAAPAGFGSSPVQVGQTRYGQPPPYTQQHPQPPHAQPYAAPSDDQATQAIPGAIPAAAPAGQVPTPRREGGGHGGHGGSRGSSRGSRGPLIGAVVAIVVVIAIIGAVLAMDKDDEPAAKGGSGTTPPVSTTGQSSAPATSGAPSTPSNGRIGETEAENAALIGATVGTDGKGFTGTGFVTNLGPNASISWNVEVPDGGQYHLRVMYANGEAKGEGQQRAFKPLTVGVNGKASSSPLRLYGLGNPDTFGFTWGIVTLKQGANSLSLTCTEAAGCPVKVDSVSVMKEKPTS